MLSSRAALVILECFATAKNTLSWWSVIPNAASYCLNSEQKAIIIKTLSSIIRQKSIGPGSAAKTISTIATDKEVVIVRARASH
jgi:hypothetical protein